MAHPTFRHERDTTTPGAGQMTVDCSCGDEYTVKTNGTVDRMDPYEYLLLEAAQAEHRRTAADNPPAKETY